MTKVLITKINDSKSQGFIKLALSMYLGEKCKYCLREFITIEDLREHEVVFVRYRDCDRIACKSCWDKRKFRRVDNGTKRII